MRMIVGFGIADQYLIFGEFEPLDKGIVEIWQKKVWKAIRDRFRDVGSRVGRDSTSTRRAASLAVRRS
jgi:hypothetical protein